MNTEGKYPLVVAEHRTERESAHEWVGELQVVPGVTLVVETDAHPRSIEQALVGIDVAVADVKSQLSKLVNPSTGDVVVDTGDDG